MLKWVSWVHRLEVARNLCYLWGYIWLIGYRNNLRVQKNGVINYEGIIYKTENILRS